MISLVCAYKDRISSIASNSPAGRVVRPLSFRYLGAEPAETGINELAKGTPSAVTQCMPTTQRRLYY